MSAAHLKRISSGEPYTRSMQGLFLFLKKEKLSMQCRSHILSLGYVLFVSRTKPTNLMLAMAKVLVLVWMIAKALACPWHLTNLVKKLAAFVKSCVRKTMTFRYASVGRVGMGSNQTNPNNKTLFDLPKHTRALSYIGTG